MRTPLTIWIPFLCNCCWVWGLECGYPGAPAFGRPHPLKESYRPGDAVTYSCHHGYSQQGPLQRLCLENGTWSPRQLPLCDRSLPTLEHQASSRQTLGLYPANKSIDGDPKTCAYTDKLRPRWIRVDMRDSRRVKAVALTVPQGIYSRDAAQLTIYAISVRDATTASYHKCASFNGRFAATTLKLTCAGGDVEGRYIHIEDNRHRVDYFSLCEIQIYAKKERYACGEAERPTHAYSVRTETGAVQYRCVYGYRLEGPDTRVCMENGQWSLHPPLCKEIVCPTLEGVQHGRIQYVSRKSDSLTLGTVLNLTCDYGYRPSGSPLVCGEDGRWSQGRLLCEPVECGLPAVQGSEQLLNGTRYGSVALVKCGDQEDSIVCREDGTWSTSGMDCDPRSRLSRWVEEDSSHASTGIVVGMAAVVFVLLSLVAVILLIKRRKVLRESGTDAHCSKETDSSQPYENDAFYATIPVDNEVEDKGDIMSTVLFTGKKSEDASCIYEEIRSKGEETRGEASAEKVPVYAQVNLEEKRRSRLVKSLFEPLDPPAWENRSEESFGEVDLEPIKLRELPPIPDEGSTYASLSIPLEPPNFVLEHQQCTTLQKGGGCMYMHTVKGRDTLIGEKNVGSVLES